MNLTDYVKQYGDNIVDWPGSIKDKAVEQWLGYMSEASPNVYEVKHDEIRLIIQGLYFAYRNAIEASNNRLAGTAVNFCCDVCNSTYQAVETDLTTYIQAVNKETK